MSKRMSEHPTELELLILQVLWEESPLPVGDVQEKLAEGRAKRDLTYSTVITVLNVMVRKKYLKREKQGKAFLYSPLVSEVSVSQGMLGDIVDRVFDGSASSVMMNLLEKGDMDPEELKEIRKMINRIVRGDSQ
jgi:BlaI family transcriptional regulator, penicillinase repressor